MTKSKKLIFSILGLFLLINLACEEQAKKKTLEVLEEAVMTSKPKGIISLAEAKVLCTNYEDRRIPSIIKFETEQSNSDDAKFVPTQFIDFDYETIKKYIKYVEERAAEAKVKPDSLRIYYGNYGADKKDTNKNTVFMLPTTTIDGDHGGFFINAKGNAELIRNYWPKTENNSVKNEASFMPSFSTSLYEDESLILNNGNGGPPPINDF